jgi:hypothetical protein
MCMKFFKNSISTTFVHFHYCLLAFDRRNELQSSVLSQSEGQTTTNHVNPKDATANFVYWEVVVTEGDDHC